jgi:hypothetical protein
MAKKKHPIYRLHKIKIHPNRWLAWTIAYAVIVAIALIGYITVSEVNFESQIAENEYHPRHFYQNTRLGFSANFPADWAIESDVNLNMVSFVPANGPDLSVG